MSRRIGVAAVVLGVLCTTAALVTRKTVFRGVYFNASVDEPTWLFDPGHVTEWLVAAGLLIVAGTLLLARRPVNTLGVGANLVAVACLVVAQVRRETGPVAAFGALDRDPLVLEPNITLWLVLAMALTVLGTAILLRRRGDEFPSAAPSYRP